VKVCTPEQSQLKRAIECSGVTDPGFFAPASRGEARELSTDALLTDAFNGLDDLEFGSVKENITVDRATSPGLEFEEGRMGSTEMAGPIDGLGTVVKDALGPPKLQTQDAWFDLLRSQEETMAGGSPAIQADTTQHLELCDLERGIGPPHLVGDP
jgi:hypothetical protein